MRKKYFFFDIDGTLTDSARYIVPSARSALEQLQKNGHFVAVATGRAHYKTAEFTDPIGIRNLVCNGGCCLVHEAVMVRDETLDIEKARAILRQADEQGIGWMITLEDSDAVFMRDLRFLSTAGRRSEQTSYRYDPLLDYNHLTRIYKIYLAVPEDREEAYDWIGQLPYLRFNPRYIVFEQDEKKEGIIRMMELVNGPLEDVVVFGDGKNDLRMFDERWMKIAMGNGSPILKEKADYVTSRNTEDGILHACRHFGWIE